MKRALIVATILTLAMASSVMAESSGMDSYGWSLSGSSTDPTVYTGPALAATPFFVHLWFSCSPIDGISAAEFSMSTNFFDAGFTPLNGVLNAGNSVDLLLAVGGCPLSDFLAGKWQFLDFTGLGGTCCMVPSPTGTNASVDCDTINPQVWPNAITGYSTDGTPPCQVGFCVWIDAVEPNSWGAIKGMYR